VIPLLMIGGAFLCYEGFEKVAHKLLHSKEEDDAHHQELTHALVDENVDLVAVEKDKIKGAIRTDFILSAEIIVISLGTVTGKTLTEQFMVLATIAIVMTIGVYGLVAGIVKLDDAGLHLSKKASAAAQGLGKALLLMAPKLMKTLAVVGTAAMFMVGGSILVHGVPALAHMSHDVAEAAAAVPGIGGALKFIAPTLVDLVAGVIAGGIVLLVVTGVKRLFKRKG
jgi:predicted DNA repair protein MutK